MQIIIGIDGGGTKTACVASDLDGNILHQINGGPSNFLMIGTEKVSETLLELVENCISTLNLKYSDILAVVLGTTGAGRRSDAERLEKAFNEYSFSKGITINNFYVDSDARVALEGAFSGKPGSILIAGTGSIMFGKDKDGIIHRVGGFGRFIGDQGSGYMLGKKGLTAVAKDFDGRSKKTLLSTLAAEQFKFDTPEILITEIYKNNFDIASAAPLVFDAAQQNDETALQIIDEESNELLLHFDSMLKKINEPELCVSFIGSIITNDNIFSRTLKKKINEKFPQVIIKDADYPPAMGAVLMAKKIVNN